MSSPFFRHPGALTCLFLLVTCGPPTLAQNSYQPSEDAIESVVNGEAATYDAHSPVYADGSSTLPREDLDVIIHVEPVRPKPETTTPLPTKVVVAHKAIHGAHRKTHVRPRPKPQTKSSRRPIAAAVLLGILGIVGYSIRNRGRSRKQTSPAAAPSAT